MLKNSAFLNFFNWDKISLDNVFYFVERFGLYFSATQLNELDEQFLKYQLLKEIDIPASVWMEDAEVKDWDDLKYYRMDVIWGSLAKQKTIFGKLEFDLLSKIAKLVFVLPYEGLCNIHAKKRLTIHFTNNLYNDINVFVKMHDSRVAPLCAEFIGCY